MLIFLYIFTFLSSFKSLDLKMETILCKAWMKYFKYINGEKNAKNFQINNSYKSKIIN